MAKEVYDGRIFPSLQDHKFQDWMAHRDVNLLERVKCTTDPEQIKQVFHRFWVGKLILEKLNDNRGYIVPFDQLVAAAYNGFTEPSDNQSAAQRMNYLSKAANKYRVPLLYIPIIGAGLDLQNFSLSPSALTLLYPLWQRKNNFLSTRELAYELYGENTDGEVRGVYNHMYKLKRLLEKRSKTARIVTPGKYVTGGYKLTIIGT